MVHIQDVQPRHAAEAATNLSVERVLHWTDLVVPAALVATAAWIVLLLWAAVSLIEKWLL